MFPEWEKKLKEAYASSERLDRFSKIEKEWNLRDIVIVLKFLTPNSNNYIYRVKCMCNWSVIKSAWSLKYYTVVKSTTLM